MVRPAKREVLYVSSDSEDSEAEVGAFDDPVAADCRSLRSRYLAVRTLISDEKDDITKVDSDKFKVIFDQVESLHQKVQKPREQVADAEALLGITNSLFISVKAQNTAGISIADFVSSLLRNFGRARGRSSSREEYRNSIAWKEIGCAVSQAFRSCPGCCTMIGPMNDEPKKKRAVVRRKRVKPTERAVPKELGDALTEKKTDTDKNMAVMFDILKKNRSVRIENLVLNPDSFAQTVENLFALSFLVKDGRVEIKVDDNGCHLVLPRNAPATSSVISKEVAYSQFVFRLDYNDWKMMKSFVKVGEELMPRRNQDVPGGCYSDPPLGEPETAGATTPIRKLSRNRGLVLQDEPVVEDSTERDNKVQRAAAIQKGKRKLTI
ncbi:hypothetical protein SLE2022_063270 [Rubroshorea leprosula]